MKQLTEQLKNYLSADSENKPNERKQFFKLLTVKVFEYCINEKTIEHLYEDLKKELIDSKVKEYNDLQKSLDTIGNILF